MRKWINTVEKKMFEKDVLKIRGNANIVEFYHFGNLEL
jgi:hypothetical protein